MSKRGMLLCLLLGAYSWGISAGTMPYAASGHHVVVAPDAVQWGPPLQEAMSGPPPAEFQNQPPFQAAVISGVPTTPGAPYVLRLKLPDGFKVAPHWHPADENVTVLQGAICLGVAEKFDPAGCQDLKVGAFALMPKEVRHFAMAKGETIIQVHGVGPFKIIWVEAGQTAPAQTGANK